jgi:hypothetical protein
MDHQRASKLAALRIAPERIPQRRARVGAALSAILGVAAGFVVLQLLPVKSDRVLHRNSPVLPIAERQSPGTASSVATVERESPVGRRKFEPAAYRVLMAINNGPDLIHQSEGRDPTWAPEMETQISERFHSDVAPKLGIRFTNVYCRASSCLISVELAEDQKLKLAPESRFEDLRMRLGAFQNLTGPFASRMSEIAPDPSVNWKHSLLLFFSQNEIDPADYAAWVSRSRIKAQQGLARDGTTLQSLYPTIDLTGLER